ncbi:hypothetical protein D9M72_390720 [compost metagenome]
MERSRQPRRSLNEGMESPRARAGRHPGRRNCRAERLRRARHRHGPARDPRHAVSAVLPHQVVHRGRTRPAGRRTQARLGPAGARGASRIPPARSGGDRAPDRARPAVPPQRAAAPRLDPHARRPEQRADAGRAQAPRAEQGPARHLPVLEPRLPRRGHGHRTDQRPELPGLHHRAPDAAAGLQALRLFHRSARRGRRRRAPARDGRQ